MVLLATTALRPLSRLRAGQSHMMEIDRFHTLSSCSGLPAFAKELRRAELLCRGEAEGEDRTRASINLQRVLAKWMDGRVKPTAVRFDFCGQGT